MSTHTAFEEAVASYALGVLEGAHREAFESHLAECARCQQDLDDFRRVAAGLNFAVEDVPLPESLKARVLAHAVAQPQQQLVEPEPASVDVFQPRDETPASSEPERWTATEDASGRSISWLPFAAAVLVAAGLGGYALSLRQQVQALSATVLDLSRGADSLRAEVTALRRDSARLINVMEVLRAPDTLRVDLRGQAGAPGSVGRAYVSRTRGLVFSVDRLPGLSSGRVYQIWVIPAGRVPLSAGVFSVSASGAYDVALPLPAAAELVRGIAVTVEPGPSGSPQGTTPPVLLGLGTE